jgi:hypothetical protein
VLNIAAVHEFGAPKRNIPMRSFMRTALDENRNNIEHLMEVEYKQAALGRLTLEQAIGRVGEAMVNAIKNKIRQGPFEPLAESTIRAKKSSKPLIDTAQMLNSIQHVEVVQ